MQVVGSCLIFYLLPRVHAGNCLVVSTNSSA